MILETTVCFPAMDRSKKETRLGDRYALSINLEPGAASLAPPVICQLNQRLMRSGDRVRDEKQHMGQHVALQDVKQRQITDRHTDRAKHSKAKQTVSAQTLELTGKKRRKRESWRPSMQQISGESLPPRPFSLLRTTVRLLLQHTAYGLRLTAYAYGTTKASREVSSGRSPRHG
jgi:hypothetical protein